MDKTDDHRSTSSNRRRFLKKLGALSVVGLAGCGGDGDGGTDTDEDTPTETNDGMDETPTDTDNGTDETPTDTATTTPVFGDNPAQLIAFSGSAQVAPGGTVTLTGTIDNPYLFEVTNGEFTVEGPEGWTVEAVSGAEFTSLESQAEQTVEWEVAAPEDAGGTFELSFSGTYQGPNGTDTAEVSTTLPILAKAPGQAPIGLDCGGAQTDETVTIDGLPFQPDAETARSIDITSNRQLEAGEAWWGENITVDPLPNSNQGGSPEITDTDADSMYWTEWWQEDQFTVTIDIENGSYDVIFHAAEVVFSSEGARVFGATVNGETAFEGLDIYAEAGAETAVTRSIEGVEVTDNTLEIVVESSVENPKLSGLEIREA